MFKKTAQASVEIMIILAVSLVILLFVFSLSNQSITDFGKQKLVDEARVSVKKLANAANDVYRQGIGAKKKVFFSVPTNVDENKSGIEANSFVLNVLNSDVYAKPETCLTGSIPTSYGGHWVWLTARENCVYVGTELITTNKSSIYVTLNQSDSQDANIIITNEGDENAIVFLTLNWTHSDVNVDLNITQFDLNANESREVTLTFTSNSTATGNYSGLLNIGGHFDSGNDENISVPLNVEIIGSSGSTSVLNVFPSTHSETVFAGESDLNSFQVCNSGSSELTNISFTGSGSIAPWLESIPNLSSLASETCETIDFNITPPVGTSAGNYSGAITAEDDSSNSDSISINLTVESMSDYIIWDWTNAYFSNNRNLDDWNVFNSHSSKSITITRMQVIDFNILDQDNSQIDYVRYDGSTLWNGTSDAGEWLDLDPDFTLSSLTDYPNNNRIRFTSNTHDDGEYIRVILEMLDGSNYTSGTFYTQDMLPPIVSLESPDVNYTSNNSVVQFDYNVNDVDSGIASCELIIDGTSVMTDNTITENTTQTFTYTLTSNGFHYWDVNCTDDSINSNEGSSDENRLIKLVSFVAEFGSVEANGTWKTVSLQNSFVNPIVVAMYHESNNSNSISVRIRNVSTTGFEVRLENPSGSTPSTDNVHYLVMEEGNWNNGGVLMEAHSHSSSITGYSPSHWNGDSISYDNSYSSAPIVLHQVVSSNDSDWISSFVRSPTSRSNPPTTSGFQLALNGAQATTSHGSEIIDWIAIERNTTGTIMGKSFETRITSDSVRGHSDGCYNFSFTNSYLDPPLVIGSQEEMDGSDGSWLVGCNLTSSQIGVHAEEDQVGDTERNHTTETTAFIAIEHNDVNAPIISLETPLDGNITNETTIQFDYNVNDVDSGIASCELIIDGTSVMTDNTITENTTQTFTYNLNPGTHHWDVNCTDDSGHANEGTSGENRLIINGPIVIAYDVFPDSTWDEGEGWLDDWYHTGDSTISNWGSPHSSPRHLRLRRATGYVDRSVDLSNYCNPRLEFWAKAESFESGEEAYVKVSPDDSTWYTLKTWVNGDDDGAYHFYAFDLNSYNLTSEFWIAFEAGMGSTSDRFYVDDVNIVQRTHTCTASASPMAAWEFDEGSGSTAGDSSSDGGNNGSINGASWTEGISNSGLRFDGVDDEVNVPMSLGLLRFAGGKGLNDDLTEFGISAWVNLNAFDHDADVVYKNSNYFMRLSKSGEAYKLSGIVYLDGKYNSVTVDWSDRISDTGVWHYLVFNYTGSELQLFIDGELKKTSEASGTVKSNSNDLFIGGHNSDHVVNGVIDKVIIWDKALTETEVNSKYNANVVEADETILGKWKLDENNGTTAFDSSINNNSGEINNCKWSEGVNYSALSFNGKDAYVEISDDDVFDVEKEMSISAWAKVTKLGTTKVLQKGDWDGHGIYLDLWNGWTTSYRIKGKSIKVNWGEGQPKTDRWYFIASVYNGEEIQLFVDGKLMNSTKASGLLDSNTRPVLIGSSGGAKFFNGLIDECKIYSKALTSQEILNEYNEYNPY